LSINIRQANLEDVDKVYELETLCFKDPYPKKLLFLLLSLYPELFLVAEAGHRIVGYVSGLIRRDGYGHIVSICVHPEHRGKGLGTLMMRSIEIILKENFGICRYLLEVRVSNNAAIKLYHKLGYSIVKTIPKYYLDGEDAYLMIKDSC
jgi:ribosomal-protein-alanine N-acetyltransferase